jgi:hypothetical protein
MVLSGGDGQTSFDKAQLDAARTNLSDVTHEGDHAAGIHTPPTSPKSKLWPKKRPQPKPIPFFPRQQSRWVVPAVPSPSHIPPLPPPPSPPPSAPKGRK